MTLLYFRLFEITNLLANASNNVLLKIDNWAYQWKINFNPAPAKQVQVIFSRKIKKPSQPVLIFNNNQIIQTPYQKHLGVFLDEKLKLW